MDKEFAGTRVFLVEDEGLVAMQAEAMLRNMGCEVVGMATRFQDGMDKSSSGKFDFAVLDINLNGTMSYPIATALLARGVPFVFATGYGTRGLPDELRVAPVIAKPYDEADLAAAMRAARSLGTPAAA